MPELSKASLIGTWSLYKMTLDDIPWRIKSYGQLIYTSDGSMSVGINGSDPEYSWDDNCIFYAGKFVVDGDTIIHKVVVSSSKEKIGEDLIRNAKLENGLLTLTAETAFGFGKVVWRK